MKPANYPTVLAKSSVAGLKLGLIKRRIRTASFHEW
jgi:hypothetical protein